MADKNVLILVEQSRKADIDQIAKDLGKMGLKVDKKLSITGVISGSIASEDVDNLKDIEGVAELREERVFTLPPLDDDTPQ